MRWITFGTVVMCAALLAAPPAEAAGASQSAAAKTAAARLDLNKATVTQLQELPGIGARTAERIVEYRQANGDFEKIEDLMRVRGIGEKSFLKLKDLITVSAAKPGRTPQASQV